VRAGSALVRAGRAQQRAAREPICMALELKPVVAQPQLLMPPVLGSSAQQAPLAEFPTRNWRCGHPPPRARPAVDGSALIAWYREPFPLPRTVDAPALRWFLFASGAW